MMLSDGTHEENKIWVTAYLQKPFAKKNLEPLAAQHAQTSRAQYMLLDFEVVKMNTKQCPQGSKVTVGVCVKNSEAGIREALNSVVAQDYPHRLMELIIVDGRSQDQTLKITYDILKRTDIISKIFSENKGLGHARQTVLDNACGDYIVWVDGDMILTNDFVRMQVKFMDQHPEAGIGKGKYGARTNAANKSIVATLENVEFMLQTLFEGKTNSKALGTSGCIYRVVAIKQIGGFDTEIRGVGEDMDVENRIREKGWLLYVSLGVFYETRRQTWASLWREYFWHGSGGKQIFEKNRNIIGLHNMFPPTVLVRVFLRIPRAYRLTHKRLVLLLPLHYAFKRTAWLLGFFNSFF